MKKVTKHGKRRLLERNINKGRNGISLLAKKNGKDKNFFKGKFYNYLKVKEGQGKIIKVYKNNIYIYSKTSNDLITTYSVPNKYLPVEKYLFDDQRINAIRDTRMYFGKECVIVLKNRSEIKGSIIEKIYNKKDILAGIIILDNKNKKQMIFLKDIEIIKINEEEMNKKIAKEMGIKL